MKTCTMYFSILVLLVLASASVAPVAAQEMSKETWQQQISTFTQQRSDLGNQISTLDKEISDLRARSQTASADVRACEDALIALLGTREEYEAFERDLATMEKRVADLQGMSDAQLMGYRDELMQMDERLADMGKSKMALIPRFRDRVASLREKVAGLLKTAGREKTYTVGTWSRDRDCLWNIAKKRDIYANAWLWPKIWQGNRDKIKDPDVIQPKWVLRIPEGNELTQEEKSAANRYYRGKTAAADAGTQ